MPYTILASKVQEFCSTSPTFHELKSMVTIQHGEHTKGGEVRRKISRELRGMSDPYWREDDDATEEWPGQQNEQVRFY